MNAIAPPRWAEHYVGIPFKLHGSTEQACDCVGLCQLVMRKEAFIDIGRDDIYVDSFKEWPEDIISNHVGVAPWSRIIPQGKEKAFDWVLMMAIHKNGVAPLHVGIVTAPGWILHVQEGTLSSQEQLKRLRGRIVAIARHDRLP